MYDIRNLLLAAGLVAATAAVADSYRWEDAEGTVHYSQNPPPAGIRYDRTAGYDGQRDLERERNRMEVERERLELDRVRIASEKLRQSTETPSDRMPAPTHVRSGGEMSFEDRRQLQQIQRDIERLSSSGIGSVQDRQMQVNALMRQRDDIYAIYGAPVGPMIIIQDNRNQTLPPATYYPNGR